jgi:CheY-like chemotaxis protein
VIVVNTRRILVVDDEPSFVVNVVSFLEMHGYTCSSASSGVEALALIKKERPDVVILDVLMPAMDGYSLYKSLGRERKDIYWIVVTAKSKLHSLFEIEEINKIYTKPLDLDVIKRDIEEYFLNKDLEGGSAGSS